MIDQASRLRAIVSTATLSTQIRHPERHAEPVEARRMSGQSDNSTATLSGVEGPRVIAVTSGKGGVGKTTISVNLAILLAETGNKSLIVDADLGLANVDVMLGIDSPRHIGHLLTGAFDPEDIAATGPYGVSVISGGSGLRELAESGASERRLILEKLALFYRKYDYVILDTSPGISSGVTDFTASADDVFLVTTPEPTSLRDTYAAFKTMTGKSPDQRITLLVNSATSRQADAAANALNNVAMKFLDRGIENWRHIEPDVVVGRSIRDRKPLACAYPRSAATSCIRDLAKALALV